MARREGKSQAASVAQDAAALAKDTARALGKPKESGERLIGSPAVLSSMKSQTR